MKMIMKRSIKILRKILFVLLTILFFSVRYYRKYWNVDFAMALYQMSSPLKGTNPQYFIQYFQTAIIPSLVFVISWNLVWKSILYIVGNNGIYININILSHRWRWLFRNKWIHLSRTIISLMMAILGVFYIFTNAYVSGMFSFMYNYSHATEFFEDYYILPEDTQVTFPDHKKNLLLIYMESMETTYMSTDVGGGKPQNYIPEFTSLAHHNINFSNSDKLGGALPSKLTGWTMAALLGTSCGIPFKLPIGENDANIYSKFLPGVVGLGDILSQNGYHNYFLCGSDASFAGRSNFYEQHRDYIIYDYEYAINQGKEDEKDRTYWGYDDERLYEYAKEYLNEIGTKEEPFNFTMLTVDTHHPDGYVCDLCGDEYEEQYANVLACSSRQIDDFISWVENQSWYENTTVVIIGDHLSMNTDFWNDIGDYQRCIYNCFINTDKSSETLNIHNRIFSNMDFFPTILSAMSIDIEGDRLGLGTNLFSQEATLYEVLGKDYVDKQLDGYSKYYDEQFIRGDRKY